MNRIFFLLVFGLTTLLFFGQDKKPDWRKLHYLSEEEMYMPIDNRSFYETDPPVAPVRNVAEFDQMQAVLIRYPFGIPLTLVKEMAENIEVNEMSTFKDLLLANSLQIDAVAQLLIEKGVFSKDEFFDMLKRIQSEYEKKGEPNS